MSTDTQPQGKIFFIGATGYIGGSVLVGLLSHYQKYEYTALVRNPKNVKAVEGLGVKVVAGSTDDLDLVERLAEESDIVVNCSDADNLKLAVAITTGLTKDKTNEPGRRNKIYVHTSGTGVVTDKPDGVFREGKTYDDNVVEDIQSIAPDQMHREVDLHIFAASKTGLVDTYIIAPSTIYGKGRGPVNNLSAQVPTMIRTAVKRKEVVVPGPGTNVWDNVHIDDLMELYVLVFNLAISGKHTDNGYANFFWGSARSHVWLDIAQKLAGIMYMRGLVNSEQVRSVPPEEVPELAANATNSRTVANRSFALGWKPTAKSLEECLAEEVDNTVSQMQI